jgi:hypothetical protein
MKGNVCKTQNLLLAVYLLWKRLAEISECLVGIYNEHIY